MNPVSDFGDALAAQVGEALQAKGWMIGTAESCTGGLILHRLTNIPGSSAYVLGGIVAYSNAIKMGVLHVREDTLKQFGAVSEQTAHEMAQGALALLGADIALSVTGIAGPGGGSAEKPVGLVYIGAATKADGVIRIERHQWTGDRLAVKTASATRALEIALEIIHTT
jgi:PncC family amidohydrolase